MTGADKWTTVSRRYALTGMLAGGALAWAPPAWAVGAVKHYIFVELLPGADQIELDRFYMTYHAPEVRRAFKAWQRNYVSFRSYLPPAEAVEAFGVGYGRMTEIHFDTIEDFRETRPNNVYGALDSYTPPPGGWRNNRLFVSTTATVPVNPNDVYLTRATPPKETPYLRWIVFMKPPEGMTAEDGDAYWDQTLAPELAALPGVKRLARYRTVSSTQPYQRVAEFWFDDYNAWSAAFLAPDRAFTPPPWGGAFPFFETKSMFVGENPDVDFVNDKRVIP